MSLERPTLGNWQGGGDREDGNRGDDNHNDDSAAIAIGGNQGRGLGGLARLQPAPPACSAANARAWRLRRRQWWRQPP